MSSKYVLFVQPTKCPTSRSFYCHSGIEDALDEVSHVFEEKIRLETGSDEFDYELFDLFDFIDSMGDLAILKSSPDDGGYLPFGKEWIKERLYIKLRKDAGLAKDFDLESMDSDLDEEEEDDVSNNEIDNSTRNHDLPNGCANPNPQKTVSAVITAPHSSDEIMLSAEYEDEFDEDF